MTWNVNGIRARQAQVFDLLAAEAPDVLCLQEIRTGGDRVPVSLFEMAGYWSYWHGSKGYSGVAILVRQDRCPERPDVCHPEFNIENRVATVDLHGLTVASVYVPNGGKDYPAKLRFLEAMGNYVAATLRGGRPLVLCGDLNVSRADIDVHPKERKANAIGQRADERALFEKILALGLVDVTRRGDPANDGLFTWWAPWRNMRARNIGWRIDYILASSSLADRIATCRVRADFGTSDHAPIVADIQAESRASPVGH